MRCDRSNPLSTILVVLPLHSGLSLGIVSISPWTLCLHQFCIFLARVLFFFLVHLAWSRNSLFGHLLFLNLFIVISSIPIGSLVAFPLNHTFSSFYLHSFLAPYLLNHLNVIKPYYSIKSNYTAAFVASTFDGSCSQSEFAPRRAKFRWNGHSPAQRLYQGPQVPSPRSPLSLSLSLIITNTISLSTATKAEIKVLSEHLASSDVDQVAKRTTNNINIFSRMRFALNPIS